MVMGIKQFIGVNILDLLPSLSLEQMGVYELEYFARDCEIRAMTQPDNDRGCWLTEIYIELSNQAKSLRAQKLLKRRS